MLDLNTLTTAQREIMDRTAKRNTDAARRVEKAYGNGRAKSSLREKGWLDENDYPTDEALVALGLATRAQRNVNKAHEQALSEKWAREYGDMLATYAQALVGHDAVRLNEGEWFRVIDTATATVRGNEVPGVLVVYEDDRPEEVLPAGGVIAPQGAAIPAALAPSMPWFAKAGDNVQIGALEYDGRHVLGAWEPFKREGHIRNDSATLILADADGNLHFETVAAETPLYPALTNKPFAVSGRDYMSLGMDKKALKLEFYLPRQSSHGIRLDDRVRVEIGGRDTVMCQTISGNLSAAINAVDAYAQALRFAQRASASFESVK